MGSASRISAGKTLWYCLGCDVSHEASVVGGGGGGESKSMSEGWTMVAPRTYDESRSDYCCSISLRTPWFGCCAFPCDLQGFMCVLLIR